MATVRKFENIFIIETTCYYEGVPSDWGTYIRSISLSGPSLGLKEVVSEKKYQKNAVNLDYSTYKAVFARYEVKIVFSTFFKKMPVLIFKNFDRYRMKSKCGCLMGTDLKLSALFAAQFPVLLIVKILHRLDIMKLQTSCLAISKFPFRLRSKKYKF